MGPMGPRPAGLPAGREFGHSLQAKIVFFSKFWIFPDLGCFFEIFKNRRFRARDPSRWIRLEILCKMACPGAQEHLWRPIS